MYGLEIEKMTCTIPENNKRQHLSKIIVTENIKFFF